MNHLTISPNLAPISRARAWAARTVHGCGRRSARRGLRRTRDGDLDRTHSASVTNDKMPGIPRAVCLNLPQSRPNLPLARATRAVRADDGARPATVDTVRVTASSVSRDDETSNASNQRVISLKHPSISRRAQLRRRPAHQSRRRRAQSRGRLAQSHRRRAQSRDKEGEMRAIKCLKCSHLAQSPPISRNLAQSPARVGGGVPCARMAAADVECDTASSIAGGDDTLSVNI